MCRALQHVGGCPSNPRVPSASGWGTQPTGVWFQGGRKQSVVLPLWHSGAALRWHGQPGNSSQSGPLLHRVVLLFVVALFVIVCKALCMVYGRCGVVCVCGVFAVGDWCVPHGGHAHPPTPREAVLMHSVEWPTSRQCLNPQPPLSAIPVALLPAILSQSALFLGAACFEGCRALSFIVTCRGVVVGVFRPPLTQGRAGGWVADVFWCSVAYVVQQKVVGMKSAPAGFSRSVEKCFAHPQGCSDGAGVWC